MVDIEWGGGALVPPLSSPDPSGEQAGRKVDELESNVSFCPLRIVCCEGRDCRVSRRRKAEIAEVATALFN